MYQVKPDHTVTFIGAQPSGTNQAECNEVLKQGVLHMQLLILNTVFLGGRKEQICNCMLEDGPTDPEESIKAAREIKSNINDK
jgi:hypothetical protein